MIFLRVWRFLTFGFNRMAEKSVTSHHIIMKTLFSLLLSLLAISAVAQMSSVRELRLGNGMRVWVNDDRTQPKIFGAVVVKAGAKDCPNSGIAHYLEHLLFKGTTSIGTVDYAAEKLLLDSISLQYDLLAQTTDAAQRLKIQRDINTLSVRAADYAIPNEFSNLISLYGGTGLNAYTSFDETVFHNTFSPQYLRQWCALNSERLHAPVFRLFQGELETVYEEKNMYADNLLAATAERAQQFALAGTPYAYPIIGATDSLKNPRLSEMERFFHRYYVPQNMGLVLCGDLSAWDTDGGESLAELLEATFGQLGPVGDNKNLPATDVDKKIKLRDFRNMPAFRLKVPIPIVKVGGFAWQAPSESERDYAAFKVMTSMLTNGDKTGLIDSLANSSRLMFAMGMGYDFKDFSAWGFGFVPRLPFGSRKKAEQMCFEQIGRLKRGDFTDAAMEAEKLTLLRDHELSLETTDGRSKAMINAFSHGQAWQDVNGGAARIASVTRDDIMRVARRYLNDDSLKLVKKFGSYPKERVSQPGYKPVKPKNAGQQSAYAKELAKMPADTIAPRLIDMERDAEHTQLSPLTNLFVAPNPVNDVFTLQLIFRRGTADDNRLAAMAEYLNDIGTTSHCKHQFAQLLRRQGATLETTASRDAVTMTLTGFDDRFETSLRLLADFLANAKADSKQFKKLVQSTRLAERTFFKENSNIATAVLQMAEYGDSSTYLTRLSAKKLKTMDGKALVDVFRELQNWQTDIVYCGGHSIGDVAKIIRGNIDTDKPSHACQSSTRRLKAYNANTIYIYDNPSARQTVVATYQQIAPQPTTDGRARLTLWGNYFGGGMQSVMFQEIREFRSLAYYVHGIAYMPDLLRHPDYPCGYVTMVGTQSDKTMQAVALIDSLVDSMPLRETNVTAARQSVINKINNGFPSFRNIASSVANLRLRGFSTDPNASMLAAMPQMGICDIADFYKQNVQGHPRVIVIVGNKKTLDMATLAKMGKVVELRKVDIY